MSFIRPEAQAAIAKWREVLIGLGVLAIGLLWASGAGILRWVGFAVVIAGIALVVSGIQRARFRRGAGGPGVVQVDEGEVAYFGPLNGGSVSIRGLSRLVLDGRSKPAVWALYQPGRQPLHIPVNAEGGETLFDAFASLPGLQTEQMLVKLQEQKPEPVLIWAKDDRRLS
ncbi:hypothetical protein BXY66_3844 [Shimia isoporae]|uniref:Uncharacterized protein n=1 Tax=Shimia isoporae TaxID=647720 RepID=A0A4R1N8Y0_9RHOB|nr:hypothetical protein [Shimia isoporae]TCK99342.1 hypothetical protein BXY66_3844 [Shimia isoporae]